MISVRLASQNSGADQLSSAFQLTLSLNTKRGDILGKTLTCLSNHWTTLRRVHGLALFSSLRNFRSPKYRERKKADPVATRIGFQFSKPQCG